MHDEDRASARFEGDAPVAMTRAALHDRRELALVAIERTRMPMVVTDARAADAPIILANQAFLDLTGHAADTVIGQNCRFLQGPDTDPGAIAEIRERLGNGQEVHVELLNYRKDGSSFWNRLMISPIVDEAGETLYHFASQNDVSARRRAEDSEHAERRLLMEVDHRAMNALALVQSFVRLGRADTVEAYATAVQLRVDALARAHRLLAHNGWTEASLAELISLEIPDRVALRVTISGPPLALAARVVQPVALALHELMTNALSHGALASATGRVEIDWRVEGERTVVRWREQRLSHASFDGLGLHRPSKGLGLTLVRSVIERQLGGALRLDWADNGLDAQLSFASEGGRRNFNDGKPRAFYPA